jgi:hypothetical protein
MWQMLNNESQSTYKDFNDFDHNNGLTTYQYVYELKEFNIKNTTRLISWKQYSNVIVCTVDVTYSLHPAASLLEGVFLGVSVMPNEQSMTTTLYLTNVNNQWLLYYPRN